MIKVLSIGNSFSQDAHRYLYKIAKNEGIDLKCVNLYIGGCSLRTHCINILENNSAYQFELNGESLGINISISNALQSDDWDIVTLQQVSHLAPNYETYIPYITKITDYVRLFLPKTKIMLHQTWAYEQGSMRLNEELGYADQHDMFNDIEKAYNKAAKTISADAIIPCGKAMISAADSGIKVHRDTFHADLGIGRYLLGLTWFKIITGKTAQHEFTDFDISVNLSGDKNTVFNNVGMTKLIESL